MPANTVVSAAGTDASVFPLGRAIRRPPAASWFAARRSQHVGGYEESFRGMFEDQAFLAKLYLARRSLYPSECHDKYRMHVDSCVSRSTRAGRNDEATRRFLDWLERYLTAEEIRDPEIWRVS